MITEQRKFDFRKIRSKILSCLKRGFERLLACSSKKRHKSSTRAGEFLARFRRIDAVALYRASSTREHSKFDGRACIYGNEAVVILRDCARAYECEGKSRGATHTYVKPIYTSSTPGFLFSSFFLTWLLWLCSFAVRVACLCLFR